MTADGMLFEMTPEYQKRVYFGYGLNGQLKIGITGRENGRRGGEMHYTELFSIPGNLELEREYHNLFAHERIGRSEWFRITPPLLVTLTELCLKHGDDRSYQAVKAIAHEHRLIRRGDEAA
jgi:hypothetical protein